MHIIKTSMLVVVFIYHSLHLFNGVFGSDHNERAETEKRLHKTFIYRDVSFTLVRCISQEASL